MSEAGAGKTEELRHSAQRLRKEGKVAFFLRLEHIADDFDIAFEEGSLAEFDQWLASYIDNVASALSYCVTGMWLEIAWFINEEGN
ncbi:hypothetical protein ACSPJ8_003539 [Klebsiella aerogenes]|uniref:hypothetical protein n=1 Tax=Klebsiella aerogenes TaxID=548 RepID=UPI00397B10B1|nr:hypothetical protein [Klebsiella aerogenes]